MINSKQLKMHRMHFQHHKDIPLTEKLYFWAKHPQDPKQGPLSSSSTVKTLWFWPKLRQFFHKSANTTNWADGIWTFSDMQYKLLLHFPSKGLINNITLTNGMINVSQLTQKCSFNANFASRQFMNRSLCVVLLCNMLHYYDIFNFGFKEGKKRLNTCFPMLCTL